MQTKPKFALYTLAAIIGVACLMLTLSAPDAAQAQAQGDYDADNDGLIDINFLEQLDAVHYDLNGDGAADPDADATAYTAAFPGAIAGMGCPASGCIGYELIRSLDFNDPASYAASAVNAAWTSGGGWFPIGVRDADHSFASTFDGNNNTIANLFIDDARHQPDMIAEIAALFGRNEGTIQNVGVTNANITGHYDVAILAGYNHGVIQDSYSTGSATGDNNIGGLVGENDAGAVITRSRSSAAVIGSTDVGGLVGSNGGSITHSHATGAVVGEEEVGGLVGESHRSAISNCSATGSVQGFEQTGGLIGRSERSDITLSYATGEVRGGGGLAGGLVGQSRGGIVQGRHTGDISFSYATGDVVTPGTASIVGGLVGRANNSRITASYATGDIPASLNVAGGLVGASVRADITASYATGNIAGSDFLGGLIGINALSAINSSFYTGRITTGQNPLYIIDEALVGGIVGSDAAGTFASGTYVATYWDTERSMLAAGVGAVLARQTAPEGKTTAELQAPTDYTGIYAAWRTDDDFWDFGASNQYPALKADINGDGVATWQEFGNQDRSPAPLPPIPDPEPTPTTNQDVLTSLDAVMQALQAFREVLNRRLTGSDNGGAQPAPTPVSTPVTSPTPISQVDACVETLTLSDTIYGTWGSDCDTDRTPLSATAGTRYARYYAFTLTQASTVTITLTSQDNPDTSRYESDTHLYLLEGVGRDGAVLYEHDDIDSTARNFGSRISETLPAGSYTIVATTFYAEQAGEFTLEALVSADATTQ